MAHTFYSANNSALPKNSVHRKRQTRLLVNKSARWGREEGLNGGGPLVGCRLKFSYFVVSRLKFSIFVGTWLNFLIFVGYRKISVNK